MLQVNELKSIFRFNINSSYLAGQYWTHRDDIFTYLISNEESILWWRNLNYSMFDMLRFLTFFSGDKLKHVSVSSPAHF